MMVSIETIADLLEEAIEDADAEKTLLLILEMKKAVSTDPVAVKWVVDPKNLSHIQSLLVENLDISQRMMRVKDRSEHRQKRAYMFVEAMEHAVRRVL